MHRNATTQQHIVYSLFKVSLDFFTSERIFLKFLLGSFLVLRPKGLLDENAPFHPFPKGSKLPQERQKLGQTFVCLLELLISPVCVVAAGNHQ